MCGAIQTLPGDAHFFQAGGPGILDQTGTPNSIMHTFALSSMCIPTLQIITVKPHTLSCAVR